MSLMLRFIALENLKKSSNFIPNGLLTARLSVLDDTHPTTTADIATNFNIALLSNAMRAMTLIELMHRLSCADIRLIEIISIDKHVALRVVDMT
jgi:hypothetical protein